MTFSRENRGWHTGREIAAGLLVGTIWGLAEYLGNIILFRLHWGYGLEIGPTGLSLAVASGAGIGLTLALLPGTVRRLLSHVGGGADSGEAFSFQVARFSYLVACVAVFVFIDAVLLDRTPLLARRTLPYLVSWVAITLFVYLALKRTVLSRTRRGGGRSLAFMSLAILLCLTGTYQYLAVYHRLNGRKEVTGPKGRLAGEGMPNVLLITIDTLRPDHLGCYGSRNVETETLDALAEEGILFETALTCIPYTLPSHTSIMTSLYPESHGVLMNVNYQVPADRLTLAEVLSRSGYQTAAFVSSAVLASRRGLDQGFDLYDDEAVSVYLTLPEFLGGLRPTVPRHDLYWRKIFPKWVYRLESSYRRAQFTTDRAVGWLHDRRRDDRPFFLWIHYYDPHIPLDPPEPYSAMYSLPEETRRAIRAKEDSLVLHGPKWEIMRKMPDPSLYDGEVTYTDHQLGRLIRALEEEHLTEHTLIVAAADHGEHLTEHNYFGHSMLLYRPSVDIPLIISHRGSLPAGVRVRSLARSIDIAPTVLDYLGLPIPESMEGRSLLPDIRGATPPGSEPGAFVETFCPDVPLLSYVSGRWTLIEAADGSGKELYDNATDPGQRNNLYDDHRALADSLAAILREVRRRYAIAGREEESKSEMDAGTLEALRALGYVK